MLFFCSLKKTNSPQSNIPRIISIRNFGAFVTLSPELCFVVEDDHSVVGFVAAASNAKELHRRIRLVWIPEMQTKYPELFQCSSTEEANIPVPLKVICLFQNN